MEYDAFRTVLTAFADKPADVSLERGELIVEIRDEIIEAKIFMRSGDLWVEENGARYRDTDWIVKRVGRLPVLADRILSQVQDERHFIEPAGMLLNRMEVSPSDDSQEAVDQVSSTILKLLDQRPAGTSTGLYVTSDAGEGKTTLIHHLARHQAQQYKAKNTDWILVPIALGGRPFLRFDDVIIGTLVNTLRFPFLYYDAFVWLVRLGVIVPALDGFEEMFVEGQAGDAVSALGNLMQLLDSRGTILIAARSAYFEYKSLRAQAALFDSMGSRRADFARIHLSRWDRQRFISYATKRDFSDGDVLFRQVAERLKDEHHPLLTRAVLVRRLLDVASNGSDREDLLENVSADNDRFFDRFIETIIEREARLKWIDRAGEPAGALLTLRQHHELLSDLALEMWDNETAVLKAAMFDDVVDLYAEAREIGSRIVDQIRRRIRQHALIAVADDERDSFRFDHEEFYHYFLGEAVARTIGAGTIADVRRIFRIARLPDIAIQVAARLILGDHPSWESSITTLNDACSIEPSASFVRDNAGNLSMRLVNRAVIKGRLHLRRMSFPVDALKSACIRDVDFYDCYFQRTSLFHSMILSCSFDECQFEQLDFSETRRIAESQLRDCEVFSVLRNADESAVFAPSSVDRVLRQYGFQIPDVEIKREDDPEEELDQDRSLILTERMCRAFFRSTGVNEDTFRKRLGKDANTFFREVLPVLEKYKVVKQVEYEGAGQQRRFQLGVSLRDVQEAIEQATGSFDRFLAGISR